MTVSREGYTGRSHIVYGTLIIVVGIVFLLNNLDIADAGNVFRFWPVVLILIGLAKFMDAFTPAGRFTGLVFFAIGALLLLDRLDVIDFRLWQWWPLILVMLGGSLLLNSTKRKASAGDPSLPVGILEDPDSKLSVFCFLGGNHRICTSQDFRGGEITAFMGGCDVDLRRALCKSGRASVSIFVIWGGIKIRVPEGWNVVVDTTPILGGVENKTHAPGAPDGPQLIVRGFAIMGGAEVCH
jgi:predicted membrane protein